MIYVITSMKLGFKYLNQKRSRDGLFHSYLKRTSKTQRKHFSTLKEKTHGWFKNLKTAKKCVEENLGDIYENEFFLAVIEEVPEGVNSVPTKEFWYIWNKGKYRPIEKPKHFENIVCFWS